MDFGQVLESLLPLKYVSVMQEINKVEKGILCNLVHKINQGHSSFY